MGRALGRTVIVFVCLVFIGLCSPAEAKRVALVIGNAAYEHATRLDNPKNDANALAAVLERLNFEVVKGIDLNQSQFEQTIRKFARTVRGADVALLFYAGHGLQVNGRNYLAPVDARLSDEADLDFETLPLRTILKQMEREVKTNLVFLDACRDNPLARNLARSMGTRSASVGRGLARVDSGIGTLIAFATEPGNVALDGDGNNSPFTTALLKHIETPGLDIAQMMRRVRGDVMRSTAQRQVPWNNSSLTGDFYFAGKAATTAGNDKPKDDAKLSALQKELAELREELKKRSPSRPEPRDDGKMEAMQKELAALKKRLEEKDQGFRDAARESTDAEFRSDIAKGPAPIHDCDRLAAHPYVSDRVGDGVQFLKIDTKSAIIACQAAIHRYPNENRFVFQLARARLAAREDVAAVNAFKSLAKKGYGPAMANLGFVYSVGRGVEKSYSKAFNWAKKASDMGEPDGMLRLGVFYALGRGTSKDETAAAEWFKKAAKEGHVTAMANQGFLKLQSEGFSNPRSEGLELIRKAAERGDPIAMRLMGETYEHGWRGEKDYKQAVNWHRRAMEAGSLHAIRHLGNLYRLGRGVEKDEAEAIRLYRKAADLGDARSTYTIGISYETGSGVAKDHASAARYVFQSIKEGYDPGDRLGYNKEDAWSMEFRREFQRLMKDEGIYSGPVNGSFGRETQQAIRALKAKS